MLALLIAAAALATPSGPMPAITVVDAQCHSSSVLAAGEILEAVHVVTWQSCAPGGPCSQIGYEDQGLSEVVLREGDDLVRGSWKKTSRSCGEARVWRWSKPLKPGTYTLIRGSGFGYAQVYVHPEGPLGQPRVEEQHSEQILFVSPADVGFFLERGALPGYRGSLGVDEARVEVRQRWTRRTTYTEVGAGLACIVEHQHATVITVPSDGREQRFPETALREGRPGPCPSPAEAD